MTSNTKYLLEYCKLFFPFFFRVSIYVSNFSFLVALASQVSSIVSPTLFFSCFHWFFQIVHPPCITPHPNQNWSVREKFSIYLEENCKRHLSDIEHSFVQKLCFLNILLCSLSFCVHQTPMLIPTTNDDNDNVSMCHILLFVPFIFFFFLIVLVGLLFQRYRRENGLSPFGKWSFSDEYKTKTSK